MIEKLICQLLNDSSITIAEEVQSLWSGYGQIIRCVSQLTQQTYVVKVIAPDNATEHPRGWHTQVSHRRKIKSYQVEAHFYQYFAQQTDRYCKVPNLIAYKQFEHVSLLAMEDLDEQGYFVRQEVANEQSLKLAIRWLAYFHAKFLGTKRQELWPIGSYWHLATRQDEWQAMPNGKLKSSAHLIDQQLNQATFTTLIHGDAKFANFCFQHDLNDIAGVDFQYIGCGSGVKDLAYLAASCLTDEQLSHYHLKLVDWYLAELQQALVYYHKHVNFIKVSDEIKRLYPLAWADFYRFLLGWNAESAKVSNYMVQMSEQALKRF